MQADDRAKAGIFPVMLERIFCLTWNCSPFKDRSDCTKGFISLCTEKNSIIHRGNWKILRQGDLFENYLVKFCGKASMEEEQSPLLYISFFSVLTGYLCSAKTASRPFGSLKHHIYKLTWDTQLCAICEKAMQSGELYKLRKKCLITPAFYQIEKWLCFC